MKQANTCILEKLINLNPELVIVFLKHGLIDPNHDFYKNEKINIEKLVQTHMNEKFISNWNENTNTLNIKPSSLLQKISHSFQTMFK